MSTKIAFNLSSLSVKQVGVKVHIVNIIKNLDISEEEFFIYISKDAINLLDEDFIKRSKIVLLPFSSKSKFIKLFYEQVYIPLHAFFNNIRIIHSFDYSAPIFFYGYKTITIHDLNYIKNKDTFSVIQRIVRHFLYPIGIKKSKIVFTISNTVKREILNVFRNTDLSKKIHVVYNGHEHSIISNKLVNQNDIFDNNELFFLSVGSLNFHKNYIRLIKAFKTVNSNYKLIIIGRNKKDYLSVLTKVIEDNNLHDRVSVKIDVSNTDLFYYYTKSIAIILPSLYEGFGIPLLEGVYYNKNILCSDIDIFNEIGIDYVIYFNPYDIADISNKINSYIKKETKDKKSDIRKKILKKYSWTNTSKQIFYAINKLSLQINER